MKKLQYCHLVIFFLVLNITLQAQEYNFSVQNIPEALLKNANSVERINDIYIDIVAPELINYQYNVATTVINKRADAYSNLVIYYDSNKKIKNVTAFVYDQKGNRIKKIKKKDFKDYSASEGSLFVDRRVLHYKYTPTTYPYTIHYNYEIASSNTAFVPDWMYLTSFNKSIEKSTFTIIHPSYIKLNASFSNFDNYKVDINKLKNGYKIVANNISAIKYESLTPSLTKIVPTINFGINKFRLEGEEGVAENWLEYGKWYYNKLISNTLELPQSTIDKVKNITKNAKNDIEKAKIIYQFVQDKVRYISVQIGIGGYKPMDAAKVDKLGYGDCKGLTNYTSALLKAVGINSYHTLVYGGESKDVNAKIASQEGNHMILYLPLNNEDYWLECTSQIHAFGELGDFTDDRDVLVITPTGGEIKHTKTYNAEESLQHTTGKLEIDDNGNLQANIHLKATGIQYDNHLSSYHGKNPNELNKAVKNYFSEINNITFSKLEMENNKTENSYNEEFIFKAPKYAVKSGDQLYFSINAFTRTSYIPKRVRNRKLPFQLSTSYFDVDEIEITLPPSYKLNELPTDFNLDTKFGSYSIKLTKIDEHKLLYKRELLVKKGVYTAADYKQYRKFRKNIRKFDNTKLYLTKI